MDGNGEMTPLLLPQPRLDNTSGEKKTYEGTNDL